MLRPFLGFLASLSPAPLLNSLTNGLKKWDFCVLKRLSNGLFLRIRVCPSWSLPIRTAAEGSRCKYSRRLCGLCWKNLAFLTNFLWRNALWKPKTTWVALRIYARNIRLLSLCLEMAFSLKLSRGSFKGRSRTTTNSKFHWPLFREVPATAWPNLCLISTEKPTWTCLHVASMPLLEKPTWWTLLKLLLQVVEYCIHSYLLAGDLPLILTLKANACDAW